MLKINLMNSRTFKVMITFPHLLKERILEYNKLNQTDFELVETSDDEVPFCVIKINNSTEKDIFNLGYGLALKQYKLKEEGKISW